ncbi:MAG: hypothetical protein WCO78_03775 [Candidatus Roizmanbacteria bacterium]
MPVQTPHVPIRVGFDLDGVLLYNPLRIIRPLITSYKRFTKPKEEKVFHIPKGPIEKAIWKFAHVFSLFTPSGFERIEPLVKAGIIEAYLVTARYDFLKNELDSFVADHHGEQIFRQIIINDKNEQPHLYKERVIKQLGLDIYVEDNWNIVEHLTARNIPTQIWWMYNIADRSIPYPHKFAHFSDVMKTIETYEKK